MTDAVLRIAIAQADFLVGDIPGNIEKILGLAVRARDEQEVGIVVFPELALCGYPPEDLLLRPSLDGRVEAALARMNEGGYGTCRLCRRAIDRERLMIVPQARYCARCQQVKEAGR